jgi:tRNA pseudouridine(55) synthase
MDKQQRVIQFVFKPIGWTPVDCIKEYRKLLGDEKVKLTFAGRLDPMACGILPIIKGNNEEVRQSFQNNYKIYQFSVIIGIQTDTYDILGKIVKTGSLEQSIDKITEKLQEIAKSTTQEYPPYSSKTVYSDHHKRMTALWQLASEEKLPDSLPKHEIDIKYIKVLNHQQVTSQELYDMIVTRLNSLQSHHDLRQGEIKEQWTNVLTSKLNDSQKYTIINCEAKVSTGTYIRSIANDINSVAFDIYRIDMDTISIDPEKYDKFQFSLIL